MTGGTKFWLSIYGLTILGATAFAKVFSGELAMAVTTIVCGFVTGNAFITGKAIAKGKSVPDA